MTLHDAERIKRLESALRDIARGKQHDMDVTYHSAHRCRVIAREALGEWQVDGDSPRPSRLSALVLWWKNRK